MPPTAVPAVSMQPMSLLHDEDLVFLPFFKKNHFVLFLQVPVSVNLASLNLSFIHALLAAMNKNCLSSLQERIHWEDTNPTDLFKSSWIPPPQEAFGALFCALCSHCVLHKVRSPASGRQGSVLELVRCVAGPITVCCTHI